MPLVKPPEITMHAYKILFVLLLCIATILPQYALADTFCTASADGKIHTDDCTYTSYDKCKQAAGGEGKCVVDQKDPTTESPYCVVTWVIDCKYYDHESCTQAAEKKMGYCYPNSEYKNPDK